MNAIWLIVTIISCIFLIISSPELLLSSFLTGAQNGIDLCFSLAPIYLVWSGLIAVMDESGLSNIVSRVLSPLTNKLFKKESEQTKKCINLNFTANLLGAGGAATPLGIKAIQSMQNGKDKITYSSTLFTVINTTSIQLIPSTIISILLQYGANSPYSVILPTIIISTISTILGILLCQIFVKR